MSIFEEKLIKPYYPNKVVPPEYIRDILNESNQDFPKLHHEFELPHKWPVEQYKEKYEELESYTIEILAWRARWFGKKQTEP